MTKYIITGLMLLAIHIVNAQKITISGYVKDIASKEALIGATIVNANNKSGTTTNQYGYFSLTVNTADTIELIIT